MIEEFIKWRQSAVDSFVALDSAKEKFEDNLEELFYLTLQCTSYEKQINEINGNKESSNKIEERIKQTVEEIFSCKGNIKIEELPKIDKEAENEKLTVLKDEIKDLTEQYIHAYEKFSSENFIKIKEKECIKIKSPPKEEDDIMISNEIAKLCQIIKRTKEVEDSTQGKTIELQYLLCIEDKSLNILKNMLSQAKLLLDEGYWCENYESYEPQEFEIFHTEYTIN